MGGDKWTDFLQLQDNELDSQIRMYASLHTAAQAVPVFHAYATVDTVWASIGNVFGLYGTSTSGDSEMLGFAIMIVLLMSANNGKDVRCGFMPPPRNIEAGEERCISYMSKT
ncbi:uncharacterized protein BT62DRAFT_937741 [Guyanagaster necrorhizus]|uniref:Uncharacterized protein n=1 Tax=Guyanagaster necrorhizus TaxID=856835 RepID=A0A9P7VHF6_9AGAR|nr:uncharacterized protein BT62DRAFT_937741 [Guyanagaster necrorhizus MCA 3950]KAG7440769.1 hypothetical protein BT62DRAFT_937741 [Guyanagaster necrorhizus MCA 3950]